MRGEKRSYRRYTDAFRDETVALYRRGERSVKEVARDLGMNPWTLRDWVTEDSMKRKKQPPKTKPVNAADETQAEKVARLERELARVERENARLREDREILKKAAAFFAKESE